MLTRRALHPMRSSVCACRRALGCIRHFSSSSLESATLYGRPNSSNTQKAVWSLGLVGRLPYNFVLASARLGPDSELLTDNSGGKPYGVVDTPEYKAMNPHGQIPTLRDPNQRDNSSEQQPVIVWESHSIVRYLDRAYLGGGSRPAGEQARVEMWMDWTLANFHQHNHHMIDQVARTEPKSRDMAIINRAHDGYVDLFSTVEYELSKAPEGGFVAGSAFSPADIPIAVEINRWSLCVHALRIQGTPLRTPEMPRLARYYEDMLQMKSFNDAVFAPEIAHHGLTGAEHSIIKSLGRLCT